MLSNSRTIFNQLFNEIATVCSAAEARSIVFLILEDKFDISRTEILAQKDVEVSDALERQMSQVLDRLKRNEPVQYILGKAHFYGLELKVDQRVLIPRQETEELVDWIISEQHSMNDFLDIGTGSGCIAISLAKKFMHKNITAWDHSGPALEVARENADLYHVRVDFQQVDIFTGIPESNFDLIVSNPPYIPMEEKGKMGLNVLDHEPVNALFVDDHDPLVFYHTIIQLTERILRPGGWLYFEINESFGNEVVRSLGENFFEKVELRKDLNGKNRMVRGRKSSI